MSGVDTTTTVQVVKTISENNTPSIAVSSTIPLPIQIAALPSRYLSAQDKAVYALLMSYTLKSGVCFAAPKTLAAKLKMCRQNWNRSLRRLQRHKLIHAERDQFRRPKIHMLWHKSFELFMKANKENTRAAEKLRDGEPFNPRHLFNNVYLDSSKLEDGWPPSIVLVLAGLQTLPLIDVVDGGEWFVCRGKTLATRIGMQRKTVYRILKLLEARGTIESSTLDSDKRVMLYRIK